MPFLPARAAPGNRAPDVLAAKLACTMTGYAFHPEAAARSVLSPGRPR